MNSKFKFNADDEFSGFPYEFSLILRYSRSLKFQERPDYTWLKDIFKNLFNQLNFKIRTAFDWIRLKDVKNDNMIYDGEHSFEQQGISVETMHNIDDDDDENDVVGVDKESIV